MRLPSVTRVRAKSQGLPSAEKRTAILEAAQRCFWRHGVRRTSIDDVAREAGVAKGTVYLHFESKEDLFGTLTRELCTEALAAVRTELDGSGPLQRRLTGALDAKIGRFHRLLAGSPHAAELLESKTAVAAPSVSELDTAFRKALEQALAEARVGRDSRGRAEALELVLAAGYGTAHQGDLRGESSPEAYRARLERHLELLLKGLVRRR